MGTAESRRRPRERLEAALRSILREQAVGEEAHAERLGELLIGRALFREQVGDQSRGSLPDLPEPIEDLDLTNAVEEALADIASKKPPGSIEPAAIGAGYEVTLGAEERDTHGQYFTPEPVAEALVRWAMDDDRSSSSVPRVLDPAVGTGTFLHTAFNWLRSEHSQGAPRDLLPRLVGVDIDGIALQLAGLRLAAAAGEQTLARLELHHGSFFDCQPIGVDAGAESHQLPTVDAVVGNPPYVRADRLTPDIDHFRRHLAVFGPGDDQPWLDGDEAMSQRSDAYVYFVTQATRFLTTGGRLGMVLPTKWLMSAYGEDFRRFLREHYRVHGVVGFGDRAFGEALVDTSLLLAERAPNVAASAPLEFVQLEAPEAIERVLGTVGAGHEGPPPATREQRSLTAAGSLARYLEVPADLLGLLEGPTFRRLDSLAEVARGTMTGANRCFFVDDDDRQEFGIEPEFLTPAVKSLRSVERPMVDEPAIERWLLDVHPFVEQVESSTDNGTLGAPAVKEALERAGHDGLLRYLGHAESAGWHEGRTCQSRAVWFDLGPLKIPEAFVPKLLRERVFVVKNGAAAVPSNAIDGLWPRDDVHPGALYGVLNASIGKAAMEVTGRDEAGMLQLMTYETASLPVPDVCGLATATAEAIAIAGAAYAGDPSVATLEELDRVVHEAFELSLPPERLRALSVALRRQRVDGGDSVSVPVH